MFRRLSLLKAAIAFAAVVAATAAFSVGPAAAQGGGQAMCGSRGLLGGIPGLAGIPNLPNLSGVPGLDRFGSLDVIGLTADQRLICFRDNNPGGATTIGQISGLAGDTSLVGIDFRPANNTLYGVGNAGGVYTINISTAAATKAAQLSIALSGTSFGVDVNPAADALRVVSDTGQNLRYSFAAGTTTADGMLTYPPAMTAAAGVVGAAYTNNDADPNTATTLFDIDSMLDQVAIQSPANSGQLAATGKLGVDTTPRVGFDIYSTVSNGATVDLRAFASLTVGGQSSFYRITLLTGKAELLGTFSPRNQVIGIAIPLNQQ